MYLAASHAPQPKAKPHGKRTLTFFSSPKLTDRGLLPGPYRSMAQPIRNNFRLPATCVAISQYRAEGGSPKSLSVAHFCDHNIASPRLMLSAAIPPQARPFGLSPGDGDNHGPPGLRCCLPECAAGVNAPLGQELLFRCWRSVLGPAVW